MKTDFLLYSVVAEAGQSQGGGGLLTLMPFVFLIGVMYFLMIRPQQKKAKEQQEMQSRIKVDDKVVSAGGIHGVVKSVTEKTVKVEVADKVQIEFARSSIFQAASDNQEETK